MVDLKGNWNDHLSLIEFDCNKTYNSSIKIAPYEALYRIRYISLIGWFVDGESCLIGQNVVHQSMEKREDHSTKVENNVELLEIL